MSERSSSLQAIGSALMHRAWAQLLTMIVFMAAISLRFPLWFVVLSAAVIGAAVTYRGQSLASQAYSPVHDPFLGAVLIASGLASIALTLKWWSVEKQLKLAPGLLLHFAGHAGPTPTLAWSTSL